MLQTEDEAYDAAQQAGEICRNEVCTAMDIAYISVWIPMTELACVLHHFRFIITMPKNSNHAQHHLVEERKLLRQESKQDALKYTEKQEKEYIYAELRTLLYAHKG